MNASSRNQTAGAASEGEDAAADTTTRPSSTIVSNHGMSNNVIVDVDEIMMRNQEENRVVEETEDENETTASTSSRNSIKQINNNEKNNAGEKRDIKDVEIAAVATEEVEEVDGAHEEEVAEAAFQEEEEEKEATLLLKDSPSNDEKGALLAEELQQQSQAALNILTTKGDKKNVSTCCDSNGNDISKGGHVVESVNHKEAAAHQWPIKASLPRELSSVPGGKTGANTKHDGMISKSDYTTSKSFGEEGRTATMESLFTSQIQPLPEPGSDNSNSARSRADGIPGAHAIAGVPPRFWHPTRRPGPFSSVQASTTSTASGAYSSMTTETVVEGDAPVVALPSELVVEEGSDDSATTATVRVRKVEDEEAQQVVIEGKAMPEKKRPIKSTTSTLSTGKGTTGNRSNNNDGVAWWKSSWCMAVSVGVVLVILIAASTLGCLLGGPTGDDDSSPPGTGYHTTIIVNGTEEIPAADYKLFPPFRDDLPVFTLNQIQHGGSVYYWANRWMLDDPHLDTYSYERSLQRFGLVMTYYTTHGDNWTRRDHWLSYDVSECEWYSHCSMPEYEDTPICDEDGHIIKIALASNNLQGSFIRFSGSFPYLKIYDVADNKIHGTVPHIVSSPYMEVFILSNNEFEGQLSGDGGFSSFGLRVAKLDNNNFAGYHAALLGIYEAWRFSTLLETTTRRKSPGN